MAVSKRDVMIGTAGAVLLGADRARAKSTSPRPSGFTLPNGDEVMSLLDSLPYVTFGTGNAVLYELSFRSCGPCISFARSGARDVVRAGFQVRSFIFAPKSTSGRGDAGEGQIAAVAQIYRNRDAAFFEEWYRSSNVEGFARSRGIADLSANDPGRVAVSEGRAKMKALGTLFRQSPVGANCGFPAFIWRSENGVSAKFGYGGARELLSVIRQG
jgi:hypothetical protein